MSYALEDRKCACCGKIFVPAVEHVFVSRDGFYCSWHCYNQCVYGKKRKKPPKGRRVNQYDTQGNFIATHPSIQKASVESGMGYETIRQICNEQTKTPHHYIFKYADKDNLQKGENDG